jgi:hypothetical protein
MHNNNNYKITAFDESKGQLTIQFEALDHPIVLDLHLNENGHYPEGEVLDKFIRDICPIGHVNRLIAIRGGVPNTAAIKSLVEEEQVEEVIIEAEDPNPYKLTPDQLAELKTSVIVQRILAEMIGATI